MDDINQKIPKGISGFELEEIDGELLLYSPSSTRSVFMNSTASVIWRLCDGEQTVDQIIDLLSEAFPEASESIKQDVTDSINLFIENGAIEFVPS